MVSKMVVYHVIHILQGYALRVGKAQATGINEV